jgi:DNA polymerase-1
LTKCYESTDPKDKAKARRLEKKIADINSGKFTKKEAPKELNLNSPAQMIDLFFNSEYGFKFKVKKYTKDKKTKKETKTPSTDEEALTLLKDKDKTGFIDGLLKHRELQKLYSTYIIGIDNILSDQQRVHSSFLIHGTVTGRLSSKEPNLQNVPRITTNADIKPMFIPPKGYLLLEVDYSQAELRVVAEMAKDEAMIDIFKRGYNIHFATACKANGVLDKYSQMKAIYDDPKHPDNLFWVKQHKRAKLINFGILYGQTEKKLSVELGCSEREAKEFIDQWFKGFPQIAKWIKRQHRLAAKKGYVISPWGRKRRLPDIASDSFGKFLEAQRQSVNAPIQGCASDFTQFSSVVIREKILKGELPEMIYAYTVHDSLGYFIKPEHIHKAVPQIVKICANPETMEYFGFQFKEVTMKVSPEIGRNWGDLKDYDPWANYKKLVA